MKIFDFIYDKFCKDIKTPKLDELIFKVEELQSSFKHTIEDLQHCLEATRDDLNQEKELLKRRIQRQDAILSAIIEVVPDMFWFKDLDGKYEVANKSIRDGLLFDRNPIGKDDIELSKNAKLRFGDRNHTFGETCSNSDVKVIVKALDNTFIKDDGRFFEYGKIKGKMLYLEVNKAPVFMDGELIGVVGSGRDMTYYYEHSQENQCGKCPLIENMFDKYKYINKDEKNA